MTAAHHQQRRARPAAILYVQRGCPVCAQAQLQLEQAGLRFRKVYVTKREGRFVLGDGRSPLQLQRGVLSVVPFLRDGLRCAVGLKGIRSYLQMLSQVS